MTAVMDTPLQESLTALRAALPPIARNVYRPFAELVCIDLEWDPETGELELIGIGNEHEVVQLGWRELPEAAAVGVMDRRTARAWVTNLVRRGAVVYHNADADLRKLRENGFAIEVADHHQLEDTMLAHAVLHSEEEHTLEYLCQVYGKLPPHKHLAKMAPSEYNAGDLVETVLIWKHGLLPELQADPAADFIYRHMSVPFLALQIEGEEAGIRTHQPTVKALEEEYETKIAQAGLLAQAYCGFPINLASPDQLKTWLYNVEGMPIQRKKTYGVGWGKPGPATTDKDAVAVLRRLQGTEWDPDEPPTLEEAWANVDAGGHPLLEARYLQMGAQQALSHYVQPCLGVERIYPECRQHVQVSGRHSYVGPALQQFRSKKLQAMLTPDVGTVWVGWDWSQVEARVLAYEANDTVYIELFAAGGDIHDMNMRDIFGDADVTLVSVETIATRRGFVKRFVFRLHYQGLAKNAGDIPGTRQLGLDAVKLVALSEAYLAKHPALVAYWAQAKAQAEATRLVRTFMGRPRRLTSEHQSIRDREACNHPMQGGVSDIYVTTALLLKRAAPWARLVFGAHDAQWWQVPAEREGEFVCIAVPIVTREFTVNGHRVSFPAEFKRREAV